MRFLALAPLLALLVGFAPCCFAQEQPAESALALSAHLENDTATLKDGLIWRVYADPTDGTAARFITQSDKAEPNFQLPVGAYIVHVTYGLSGTTRRIILGQKAVKDTVGINAGAIKLNATVGDAPIPPPLIRFSIFVAVGTDPEGRLIIDNIKPGTVIRLPAGIYRVVSKYGDTNAITSTDLDVTSGKLVEATLKHHAATVTLKLVNNLGGEAYAGTTFSVLTPGGDTIKELVGAFPSLILTEGDYILIARNDGKVYTSEFKVRSGFDQDIEILAR